MNKISLSTHIKAAVRRTERALEAELDEMRHKLDIRIDAHTERLIPQMLISIEGIAERQGSLAAIFDEFNDLARELSDVNDWSQIQQSSEENRIYDTEDYLRYYASSVFPKFLKSGLKRASFSSLVNKP